MLRSVEWELLTDVSGQHIGPNFKGPIVQVLLNLEDVSVKLSRNVSDFYSTLRNIPEEPKPQR